MTPSAKTADGRRVRRWTRELIIEKILEWEARYGEPPCSADWNPSLARWRAQEWRAERYREGVWPSTNAAKRPFDGSFDAAVRAAGLEPHKPGPKRKRNVAEGERDRNVVAAERSAGARSPGRRNQLHGQRSPVPPRWSVRCSWPRAVPSAPRRRSSDARRRARRAERPGRPCPACARARARRAPRCPDAGAGARRGAVADADARVRAADDQAEAAVRDAAEARRETAAAERRARELSALVGDGQRRLTGGELATLREGGPSGPTVLAGALRRLARARAAGDRGGLAAALAEVASAAVRWRDRL